MSHPAIDPDPLLQPSARARAGWLLAWVLFWLLMMTVAVQDHLRHQPDELWKPVLWESTSFIAASAMLWLQWRRATRWDSLLAEPRRWFAANLSRLPLLAPTFVVAIYAMRHGIYRLVGQSYQHAGWGEVFLYECTKFSLFYGLFLGIVFGIRSHAASSRQRLRTREAQLVQLTQQIEPHFLYNALNTIAATVYTDPALADSMLTQLAALLRASTDLARKPQCTLADELRLLEGYAAIMRARFADRVTLRYEIDDAARGCVVPTLSLQPLLENAFRHGVEHQLEPVALLVRAHCDGARLRVSVEQDSGSLPEVRELGVGLSNLRQRLAALHGDAARLELLARDGGGVLARIELPCHGV